MVLTLIRRLRKPLHKCAPDKKLEAHLKSVIGHEVPFHAKHAYNYRLLLPFLKGGLCRGFAKHASHRRNGGPLHGATRPARREGFSVVNSQETKQAPTESISTQAKSRRITP